MYSVLDWEKAGDRHASLKKRKGIGQKMLLSLLLFLCSTVLAEEEISLDSLSLSRELATSIECIAQLESKRDPKCYATASRLEDFIYGTPLSEEARFAKIDLQKELVWIIWKAADSQVAEGVRTSIAATDLGRVLIQVLPYQILQTDNWVVTLGDGQELEIAGRDKRQYSTVAYGLRAILAVQQERSISPGSDLLPFDKKATEALKEFLDIYTLAALSLADKEARLSDRYVIDEQSLKACWKRVGSLKAFEGIEQDEGKEHEISGTSENPYALTRGIIAQKIASFEAYNKISMPVFLRNIQVYFARHRWASDPEKSDRLKMVFTELMISFSKDLLEGAEKTARENQRLFIRVEDVSQFAMVFVPHRLNEFEDAIFFPNLSQNEQITIEAYDMDAFRDSGLHWRYLEAVIDDPEFGGTLEPDPFALELIVENIAQFGVLVLRVAGDAATEEGVEELTPRHVEEALRRIQQRIDTHANQKPVEQDSGNIASAVGKRTDDGTQSFFTDVTASWGVDFTHRSSDWLNRFIRSYAVRDNRVAVLAVPPAFQGSGAAAEDIDGDGDTDLLLLSGSGNRLFLNTSDGKFEDITESSGIGWVREDGLAGEPRQPIICDFDNDGLQDILITYVNDAHRLYRNIGGGRFKDVTSQAGLGGQGWVGGPATALDFDKDGLLDLYITYFGQYLDGILPTLARRNDNGLPNRLYRNTGGMRFEDVTQQSGTAGSGWTQAVAHTDFDLDGWQDLIEGNDFGVNAYYRNRGDGTFEDMADKLATDKPSYTMGFGIADLNGDDYPDIYVSNIVTMDKDQKYVNPGSDTPMKFDARTMANMRVVEANDLFVSQVTAGEGPQYVQSTAIGRGRSSTGWAWGADFFDFDNDGDDDLYVANGMNEFAVYSSENPYYKDPDGKERDVVFPESTREPNVFFLNEGGKLSNASDRSGADLLGNSRAVVYLDWDRDGDLDIVLNNLHEPAVLYRNNSERFGNHWLKIRLIGDPEQKTTRDAVGAKVVITTDDNNTVWREVHGSVGYLTMHPKEQHFGLGQSKTADAAVHWPSGEILRVSGLEANQAYSIQQKDGTVTALE